MSFWRPGGTFPTASSFDRDELKADYLVDGTTASSDTLFLHQDIYQQHQQQQHHQRETKAMMKSHRERLPIYRHKREFLYLLEKYRVIVLVGQTGCGKTTQIPQYVLEASIGEECVIACTQPRRVAATSVAVRVAQEMDTNVGELVGYAVRFEERRSPKSRIIYLTDGMLFREAMSDPLLSRYQVIMIDEAHERSIHTDLICGLLKKIMRKRPELKVIVSSATMDAKAFQDYFNGSVSGGKVIGPLLPVQLQQQTAVILSVEGRLHPIEVYHLEEPVKDHVEVSVNTVLKIHQMEEPGDILVFLTGREDIEKAMTLLRMDEQAMLNKDSCKLFSIPLYAGLSMAAQMKVFEPTPESFRKVIFSTNIAEASVTIDNIVFVVDCGLVKLKYFDPENDLDSLQVCSVSKAAALQRAGRAGRVRKGKVYRLFTESQYNEFPDNTIPEIQRSNLVPIVLQLKALGIDNLAKFQFLSPLVKDQLMKALELLFCLGALNEFGKLTDPLGLQLAEFPVDPKIGKMILASPSYYCTIDVLSIAAMLSVDNIWIMPAAGASIREKNAFEEVRSKFAVEEGDHLTYLNVYRAYTRTTRDTKWCSMHHLNQKALQRAVTIRHQLCRYAKKFALPMESCEVDSVFVRKSIGAGFFGNAAELSPDGTSYQSIRDGTILHIHPNSVLFRRVPPFVIYNDVIETTKCFMREVTVMDPSWLAEVAPKYYEYGMGQLQ